MGYFGLQDAWAELRLAPEAPGDVTKSTRTLKHVEKCDFALHVRIMFFEVLEGPRLFS